MLNDGVAAMCVKAAIECCGATRQPAENSVADVAKRRHCAEALGIQESVSLYIFNTAQRTLQQSCQVTAIHLAIAVHYDHQVGSSAQTIQIAGFRRSPDAAVLGMAEPGKPAIGNARHRRPASIRTSVVNCHDEVDKVRNSLDRALQVSLLVVNRH